MITSQLTENETAAYKSLNQACENNLPYITLDMLTDAGWTAAQAKGTFSALAKKGLIIMPERANDCAMIEDDAELLTELGLYPAYEEL